MNDVTTFVSLLTSYKVIVSRLRLISVTTHYSHPHYSTLLETCSLPNPVLPIIIVFVIFQRFWFHHFYFYTQKFGVFTLTLRWTLLIRLSKQLALFMLTFILLHEWNQIISNVLHLFFFHLTIYLYFFVSPNRSTLLFKWLHTL